MNAKKAEQELMAAPPADLLKLAETVRKMYIDNVLATKEKLDPNQLRAFDASVEKLKTAMRD